ncbi:uncharacterized protein BJ212DRAFT_1306290 [Suillus subaureus]|uniref:Uncharacterized protein n=1 Tax=Suillus subaureus TaxID=48587 RepID=A0A9P7DHM6_9AGAM|nr:uncharacterized protein BJ212DRAFT_1307169 [Suillus subaureus]XP_041185357.1 uncharacterized protein BJ212DRAFT_1306290 [Suillus subaureus]KAG1793242.1 hypothetical protein BJ212DRAFT_1307169 [Suillus subaureus]KAG1796476.1 hypothetical protein BJ212DRAFT_1306290 [Suillus subaureus]
MQSRATMTGSQTMITVSCGIQLAFLQTQFLEAHEIQELEWGIKASLKSYQLALQWHEDNVGIWIEPDMDIDLPMSSASGTYGCVDTAMEDDELTKNKIQSLAVILVRNIASGKSKGHQSPKRRRLIHGLQKTVDKAQTDQ